MPDMPKFRVSSRSFSALLSALLAMVSFVLLACVNWPTFYNYAVGSDEVNTITIVFSSVLMGSLLLYGLCTLLFAKKTLIPSVLFSLPVILFYLLDISGLRATILDFKLHDTLWHYLDNSSYYRSSWWIILLLGLIIFTAFCYFVRFAFGFARRRLSGALVAGSCAAIWLAFSIYHVVVFDYNDYISGHITGLTLAFTVLGFVASVCFFCSQFLLVLSLKPVPDTAAAQIPLPVPMTVIDPFVPLASYPASAPPSQPAAAAISMNEEPVPAVAAISTVEEPESAVPPMEAAAEPAAEPTAEPTVESVAEPVAEEPQPAEAESGPALSAEPDTAQVAAAEPAVEATSETTTPLETAAPAKKPRGRRKKAEPIAEPVSVG